MTLFWWFWGSDGSPHATECCGSPGWMLCFCFAHRERILVFCRLGFRFFFEETQWSFLLVCFRHAAGLSLSEQTLGIKLIANTFKVTFTKLNHPTPQVHLDSSMDSIFFHAVNFSLTSLPLSASSDLPGAHYQSPISNFGQWRWESLCEGRSLQTIGNRSVSRSDGLSFVSPVWLCAAPLCLSPSCLSMATCS